MAAAKPQQALLNLGGDVDVPAPQAIVRDASFSACGRYRWWLSRVWGDGPIGLVVMVNPSTASHLIDDDTIANLMKRARGWGWGGFIVVNLFALITPHPADLKKVEDPVGVENDTTIDHEVINRCTRGGRVVVAWGCSVDFNAARARAAFRGRDAAVLARLVALAPVYCIGRNADGSPTHPLARGKFMVPVGTPLELFAESA
jgi:hypothetical protein